MLQRNGLGNSLRFTLGGVTGGVLNGSTVIADSKYHHVVATYDGSTIAIYVDGVLRHPSQLYEAVLEGVIVFAVLYAYRNYKRYEGELVLLYGFSYGVARFIAEFWRQPDPQIGFICCGWMSMGQLLSGMMVVGSVIVWLLIDKRMTKLRS